MTTLKQAAWIARVGSPLLRAVGATWRIRIAGSPLDHNMRDVIIAFLHGDMLIPAIAYRQTRAAIVISRHGDGEIIAQVVKRLGALEPVRGSSSRGGAAAFLELTRGRRDMPWAITPDGPRGPRGSVQDGVVQLAADSGRPIVCAGFAVKWGKRLGSWDRFVIPYPFTRIAGHFSELIHVPPNIDRAAREEQSKQLEERLVEAHEAAGRALNSW